MLPTPLHFLKAIANDAVAIFSGIVSVALLFLGLWLPSNDYRVAVFILAGLSVLLAGYRVWADERNRWLSLSQEHQRLQQQAIDTSAALEAERGVSARYLEDIDALKADVARLRVRPFDDELKAHASSVLSSLTYMHRDLLRLLLVKGGSARGDVVFRACTNSVGLDLNLLTRPMTDSGVVTRKDDYNEGYPTFTVVPNLIEVLKELLFPRKDKEGNAKPFFNGLSN
jgi:hypothetical protein